jgi:hypothetical protein
MESELIQVEFQAAILISNINVDGVNAQVGILPVQANIHASGLHLELASSSGCKSGRTDLGYSISENPAHP